VAFVEPQYQSLLKNEPIIAEHTLRILCITCSEKPALVSAPTKPATLALFLSSVNDKSAFLDLAAMIIESCVASP